MRTAIDRAASEARAARGWLAFTFVAFRLACATNALWSEVRPAKKTAEKAAKKAAKKTAKKTVSRVMAIDVSAVGWVSEPGVYRYGWRELALYALGIGAGADELDYLYEGRGPKVFPTFAVVPSLKHVMSCAQRAGVALEDVVHGGQSVRVWARLPSSGSVITRGEIAAIYDLKTLAQLVIRTYSNMDDGTPVFDTEWTIYVRDHGGFSGTKTPVGRPPPKSELGKTPRDRRPEHTVLQGVHPEQALLYRLSGDTNPLHVDPEVAARAGFASGPILHGLATFGYSTRAIINTVCGGDSERLQFIHGLFRKPVWPGDTLATELWCESDRIVFQTRVAERGDVVINNAWAKIT